MLDSPSSLPMIVYCMTFSFRFWRELGGVGRVDVQVDVVDVAGEAPLTVKQWVFLERMRILLRQGVALEAAKYLAPLLYPAHEITDLGVLLLDRLLQFGVVHTGGVEVEQRGSHATELVLGDLQ